MLRWGATGAWHSAQGPGALLRIVRKNSRSLRALPHQQSIRSRGLLQPLSTRGVARTMRFRRVQFMRLRGSESRQIAGTLRHPHARPLRQARPTPSRQPPAGAWATLSMKFVDTTKSPHPHHVMPCHPCKNHPQSSAWHTYIAFSSASWRLTFERAATLCFNTCTKEEGHGCSDLRRCSKKCLCPRTHNAQCTYYEVCGVSCARCPLCRLCSVQHAGMLVWWLGGVGWGGGWGSINKAAE